MTMSKDRQKFYMRLAHNVALNSDDPSTKVGAVLVRERPGYDNSVPVTDAHNGLPEGVHNHPLRRERPIKYKWTAHAEERLIAKCASLGIVCENASVVTTHHPCSTCARILIEAGIKRIYFNVDVFGGDWLDDMAVSRQMLAEAGVEVVRYTEELALDDS